MTQSDATAILAAIDTTLNGIRQVFQAAIQAVVVPITPPVTVPVVVPTIPVVVPIVTPPVILPPVPTTSGALTRLDANNIVFSRSFRLPRNGDGDSYEFGGAPIAFDANTKSLYVANRRGLIAEVSIPTTDDHGVFVQDFVEMTEGKYTQAVGTDPASITGLLVLGDKLLGTYCIYYDANGSQRKSHFTRPKNLKDKGHVSDFSSVWKAEKTGFVSGYMAHVPTEWQTKLKGSVVTGQFGIPIVGRTSWGPAAFAFNPASVGTPDLIPATPLVWYDGTHQTLGTWGEPNNPVYGSTSRGGGLVLIDGTSTALFIGRNGLGKYCYGIGNADQSLEGKADGEGGHWCYDPVNSDKGPHSFPYRYQIWAYDLNDWAAVAAGTKEPWEVVPYGVWPLDLPVSEPGFGGIGGAAYNPATKEIYIAQMYADVDGYASRSYLHVLKVTV